MARRDLSFLADTPEQVIMPLTVTGQCEGTATLMQKITTLMLANQSDPTRNYGGSLGALLDGGNNSDEAIMTNYFQQAADEVYTLLVEEQELDLHDLPDSEILTNLNVDSVVITDRDSVEVSFGITTADGEVNYYTTDIPIQTGEQ